MTKITTHVLDISLGSPAHQVSITLEAMPDQCSPKFLAEGITNSDGRIVPSLHESSLLTPGLYRITFSLAHYFAQTKRQTVFPTVVVNFYIEDAKQNYHLPLLISPGGYSTYRGS